jgi:hypothetical protein
MSRLQLSFSKLDNRVKFINRLKHLIQKTFKGNLSWLCQKFFNERWHLINIRTVNFISVYDIKLDNYLKLPK